MGVGGFYIRILAAAQCGHENFYGKLLSGVRIYHIELLARIVDKYLFTRLILKVHGQALPAQVFPNVFSELAGLETVRMLQAVFFPEALAGHPFFAELLDYAGKQGLQGFQPTGAGGPRISSARPSSDSWFASSKSIPVSRNLFR